MTKLIYCNTALFREPEVASFPGMRMFSRVTDVYGKWVIPIDRSHTITTPLHLETLHPLPAYRTFTKSYEDICDDRAVELLAQADALDISIFVRYSGGIDSTLVLASLLKHATPAQKKRIVVLLSQESIAENPLFYQEHINSKLRVESSVLFANYIGENDMLLSAELNDQLLGSNMLQSLIMTCGPSIIHKPYDRDVLVDAFTQWLQDDAETATFYYELFERICKAAPIPITTNLDFLWWINFVTKWQPCLYYVLLFTTPKHTQHITQNYIDTRFVSFYNTVDFELWSMNNLDKRIKDTWKSYKWISKEVIYKFNKDADYRDNKTKVRSLPTVLRQQKIHNTFLTEGWKFTNELPLDTFLNPKNDFV